MLQEHLSLVGRTQGLSPMVLRDRTAEALCPEGPTKPVWLTFLVSLLCTDRELLILFL